MKKAKVSKSDVIK